MAENPNIDKTHYICAGKFRRYHGEGLRQLLDIKTVLLNLRDAILVLIGIVQSLFLIGRIRPASVFIKGGFVGVPVGVAAAVWRRPYITHDSDAIAGLANRLIARWARLHAVALPKQLYSYPPERTVTVGVPVREEFFDTSDESKRRYKQDLTLPEHAQVLLVMGGGLGAQIINESVLANVSALLSSYPDLHIIHITGRVHMKPVVDTYGTLLDANDQNRLIIKDYVSDLYRYTGVADVVISRAGATSVAELAAQGKACIIVPSPILAGGHQLKNAEALADARAAVIVNESTLRKEENALGRVVGELLESKEEREELAQHLHALAHPDAARLLAEHIISITRVKDAP